MAGESNCTAGTSALFLRQLRTYHPEPLSVIWDNAPAHHGAALRTSLATPALHLRLVPVPGDSPDVTADAASWDWARDEVTANTCLGTKAKVREQVGAFLRALSARAEDVKRRCRTALQSRADALETATPKTLQAPQQVGPTLALV